LISCPYGSSEVAPMGPGLSARTALVTCLDKTYPDGEFIPQGMHLP
jgi:hypothetical protein